jgi:hypothetical protein
VRKTFGAVPRVQQLKQVTLITVKVCSKFKITELKGSSNINLVTLTMTNVQRAKDLKE